MNVPWDARGLAGPFAALGNTPLAPVTLRAPSGRNVLVHVKLEGTNPTGSVKDRAAVTMIKAKMAAGELRGDSVLLDASSGNMASALAVYGRAIGVEVHVVCNATMTADKRKMIEHFGGTIIVNDLGPYTFDGYRKCRQLLEQPGADRYCFLDQLHNPHNPLAHQTGTGPEILRDLPSVGLIAGSLGSGGTMLGIGRAVRAANHPALLAAVSSAPGNRLPGVGAFADGDYCTPFISIAEAQKMFGFRPETTVAQAYEQQRTLTRSGLFCGPQTGAVVAAALRIADELELSADIVVVSGDAGWKNWADDGT